ncbi:LysR family transcriptional regulator [Klebsiella pneumoniae]|uniref:LysR family transcriptional regulator n=1 Tax=Klebsiella pneumoniae TaxID=573 RepID=A0A377U4N2_KLEPN|nr:LysR family transcriptional regulator [Klebsiella pneumoniae]
MLENLDDESAARTEADVMVLTRRQDITGRGEWLMNIDFIAVAHRDHPLAALDGPLEDSALAAVAAGAHCRSGRRWPGAARRLDLLHH